VQWLRDGLGIINSAAEVEALAASVPSSDGVVFVPAFSGLGTPDWDPTARGTLLGLTRGTTRAHIARATLEAIAFQCAELLSAMRDASGISPAELRVDGGGTANGLLMQIQADLVGIPVIRANVQETTALGAARLAGMATGLWSGVTGSTAEPASEHQWLPSISRDEAQSKLSSWRRAVPRAKGWA
jgi:glycerol kinase